MKELQPFIYTEKYFNKADESPGGYGIFPLFGEFLLDNYLLPNEVSSNIINVAVFLFLLLCLLIDSNLIAVVI